MQQNTFDEKLYTSTEVAEILGVSLRSIYRYLEEGKLNAAVKTATGRHRFTRQNINDFLHPGKQTTPMSADIPRYSDDFRKDDDKYSYVVGENKDKYIETQGAKETKELSQKELSQDVLESEGSYDASHGKATEPGIERAVSGEAESKAEPIDWLARFRQAAEKYKMQAQTESRGSLESVGSGTGSEAKSDKMPKTERSQKHMEEAFSEESVFNYYRSGVGGLKEIAQSLDKSAKNASLDYAFTMNAGLSLHKPIKPFSLIHAYVRSGDLPYFEKVLQLTPSQKEIAQLCLITSDNDNLYAKRKELHGLFVVSDSQVKADLLAEGEVELANELE